jgi:hypothetical protein
MKDSISFHFCKLNRLEEGKICGRSRLEEVKIIFSLEN